MIFVKVVEGPGELQTFLNIVGWESILQIIPSESYICKTDYSQIGAIRVPSDKVVRESTYTVIFKDNIEAAELAEIARGEVLG